MSNEYYNIYKEKILKLAESLVIKSELSAAIIDRGLKEKGFSISENPLDRRYYHNISGRYFISDEEMVIRSHDTLENIVFSKENLEIHKSTRSNYLNDSALKQTLISRYPHQSELIRGILTPVDSQVALDAPDGTILYYDRSLVEDNEIDFIDELQDFIYKHFDRWGINRYALIDDLAAAAFFANLAFLIVAVIENIRLSKCLTRQAHSYHIREYLRSHGRLDKYFDVLNKKQMLYLYKNILHIRKHAGKQEILDELIENLMTEIGLPASTYDLKHNREKNDLNDPLAYFVRRPINFIDVNRSEDTYTVDNVLQRQFPVAKLNEEQFEDQKEYILENAHDADSDLKTKIIESDMIDIGEGSPYTKEISLVDYWFYLSQLGLYDTFVTVPNPAGSEDISLSVYDAAILALYCALKSQKITPIKVPVYTLKAVRRITLPTWEQVRGLAWKEAVGDGFIDSILENNMEISEYNSVPSFREAVLKLHNRLQLHRLSLGQYGNPVKVVNAHNATMSLYRQNYVVFDETEDYITWLSERGIDLSDLQTTDYAEMFDSLVKVCTGRPENERSLADIQKGIVELISNLSSYNIQFISNINDADIFFTDRIGPGPIFYKSYLNMRGIIIKNKPRYTGIRLGLSFHGQISNNRSVSIKGFYAKNNLRFMLNRTQGIVGDNSSINLDRGFLLRNGNRLLF